MSNYYLDFGIRDNKCVLLMSMRRDKENIIDFIILETGEGEKFVEWTGKYGATRTVRKI